MVVSGPLGCQDGRGHSRRRLWCSLIPIRTFGALDAYMHHRASCVDIHDASCVDIPPSPREYRKILATNLPVRDREEIETR